jgi:hypothetical protein
MSFPSDLRLQNGESTTLIGAYPYISTLVAPILLPQGITLLNCGEIELIIVRIWLLSRSPRDT